MYFNALTIQDRHKYTNSVFAYVAIRVYQLTQRRNTTYTNAIYSLRPAMCKIISCHRGYLAITGVLETLGNGYERVYTILETSRLRISFNFSGGQYFRGIVKSSSTKARQGIHALSFFSQNFASSVISADKSADKIKQILNGNLK